MSNVIEFERPTKKTAPVFKCGSVVACKIGSPYMTVLFDSGDHVDVIYADPVNPGQSIETSFDVNDMYEVLPAPDYSNVTGNWSTVK